MFVFFLGGKAGQGLVWYGMVWHGMVQGGKWKRKPKSDRICRGVERYLGICRRPLAFLFLFYSFM